MIPIHRAAGPTPAAHCATARLRDAASSGDALRMLDAYLTRIGYDGAREAALPVLRELHRRHLLAVPFENLDIHWQRPIIVDTERFLRKIVEQHRGGFCYELNGAFAWLLRQIGFDVVMLSARVPAAGGPLGPPFDHMALLVTVDGGRWLADVGFGELSLEPLSLDGGGNGELTVVTGDECRIERNGKLEYVFTLEPHALEEFAPMCEYQQTSPHSSFTKRRVCTIATANGRITLADDRLIVTRDGVREETAVAAEEWERVLHETFGITR